MRHSGDVFQSAGVSQQPHDALPGYQPISAAEGRHDSLASHLSLNCFALAGAGPLVTLLFQTAELVPGANCFSQHKCPPQTDRRKVAESEGEGAKREEWRLKDEENRGAAPMHTRSPPCQHTHPPRNDSVRQALCLRSLSEH
ncbi:hypothetical protein EYF80_032552 [Liparis tanakae]|uniref:Uncharacterized protein n=1 Tax=Liparis tanakae TaxID=230148 RepID=A0A4Z2GUE3_9TELE|nr:hypothetical protein EYF80_032552 [Liparis tanakae]